MWTLIALIVVVIAATAACIAAWLSVLSESAGRPLCPRCGRRTRKISTTGCRPEPIATYRCRTCNDDSTPPARALRWSKSSLEPPR